MHLFQKLDYDLKKLLRPHITDWKQMNDVVFLAGAGISMEPPSTLLSTRQIMDTILKFISPDEPAFNKLRNIKDLRYEYIIEFFRDNIDKDLVFLDYFESAKVPNIIHKFLADQMKNGKGNYVMTTNFDYLIEYAFGVDDPKLRVVISKEDFKECAVPDKVYAGGSGKIPLYKLHGSKKNIKTGEDTKRWVVSTLDALGKQKKKEGEIFTVPLYQQELFRNISRDKALIVLGYSGGDDFDIMPALRIMKGLKQIIWVEHTTTPPNNNGAELGLFKMERVGPFDDSETLERINNRYKFLQQLIIENNNLDVYIVKDNTAKVICDLASWDYTPPAPAANKDNSPNTQGSFDFKVFLKKHFNAPSQLYKLFYTGLIFYNYNRYDDAMAYWKDALRVLDGKSPLKSSVSEISEEDYTLKAPIMGNMGNIYDNKGDPDKALELYQKAYNAHKQRENKFGMATQLGNMAIIYARKGDYDRALELYQKAYKLDAQLGNLRHQALLLGNMGTVYADKGDYESSLEHYQKSYNIYKDLGLLQGMADELQNLGSAYFQKGDYDKSSEFYQKSFKIDKELGNMPRMASNLGNMALIYQKKGQIDKAIEYHKKAYALHEDLGDKFGMASDLGNMGATYYLKKDFDTALQLYKDAFNTFKKLGNLQNMATMSANMGLTYRQMGDLSKAIKLYKKAYALHEDLGNKFGMASDLQNMGLTYADKGDYDKALELYQNAYDLHKDLGDKFGMASDLGVMASIYDIKGEPQQAIKHYQGLYDLFNEIGNIQNMAFSLQKMGFIYAKTKKYDLAITYLKKANKLSPNPDNAYNMACFYALKNEPKNAIKSLKNAINTDSKYLKMAKNDPDFDNIRNLKDFQNLLRTI
ncbi:MAG: tetratricopeptide repeat protein [Promethearchaeota archaeon]